MSRSTEWTRDGLFTMISKRKKNQGDHAKGLCFVQTVHLYCLPVKRLAIDRVTGREEKVK